LREAVEMMELVNGGLEGDEALTIVISMSLSLYPSLFNCPNPPDLASTPRSKTNPFLPSHLNPSTNPSPSIVHDGAGEWGFGGR
jgi:hypothetical protein